MCGGKEGKKRIVTLEMRERTQGLYTLVVRQMLLILGKGIVASPLKRLLSLLKTRFSRGCRRPDNLNIAVAFQLNQGSVEEKMLGLLL